MLETLNETAAAYTSKTRATETQDTDATACRYFIAGRCCPVGRCLENPIEFQDVHLSVILLDIGYKLESILKPEYRGYPLGFWASLQKLHDQPLFWDENGLSAMGRATVEGIKREFNL